MRLRCQHSFVLGFSVSTFFVMGAPNEHITSNVDDSVSILFPQNLLTASLFPWLQFPICLEVGSDFLSARGLLNSA